MDPLSAAVLTEKTSSDAAVPQQSPAQPTMSLSQSATVTGSKKSAGISGTATGTGSQISFSSTGTGVGFSSASSMSSGSSGGIETRVSCVAIIGKQNNPIYIRTFKDERYSSMTSSPLDKLKYHYIVHTSLDAVEEKLINSTKPDQYIGFLFPTDEGKVYGYVTCTKIKFIIIIDDGVPAGSGAAGSGAGGGNQEVKDSTIRTLFKKIHMEYTSIVSNPFYVPNQKMTSKMIDKKIEAICSGI